MPRGKASNTRNKETEWTAPLKNGASIIYSENCSNARMASAAYINAGPPPI